MPVAERVTPGISLRAAVAADADLLALIGAATFLESYAGMHTGDDILAHCRNRHSPDVYRKWLADPSVRIWIAQAEPGGAPVGYVVLERSTVPVNDPRPNDYEVTRIYMLARFQRGGTGRALMQQAMAAARTLGADRLLLAVWDENVGALGFYRRMGFTVVGERGFRVGARECHDHLMGLELQ